MVAGTQLALMCSLSPISNRLQDNGHHFPTLRCIAIDYLACPASSVPCKQLFSAGGKIATKRCSQLGAARFKELQVMKSVWKNNVTDLAAWNSNQAEEIHDEIGGYQDLLVADGERVKWDVEVDVMLFHSI